MPMDAEPARPGFIHKVQVAVRSAQRAHDLVERLEITRDHAIVADFAVAVTLGNRDVNRFLVDIQPDKHATVPHDLPPRVCCGVTPLGRDTSSTMYAAGRSMLLWRDLSAVRVLTMPPSRPPNCGAGAGGGRMS